MPRKYAHNGTTEKIRDVLRESNGLPVSTQDITVLVFGEENSKTSHRVWALLSVMLARGEVKKVPIPPHYAEHYALDPSGRGLVGWRYAKVVTRKKEAAK